MKFDYSNPKEIIEVNDESVNTKEKLTYLVMHLVNGCYDLNKELGRDLSLESTIETVYETLVNELSALEMTSIYELIKPRLEHNGLKVKELINEFINKGTDDLSYLKSNETYFSMLCFVMMNELLEQGSELLNESDAKKIIVKILFDDILKGNQINKTGIIYGDQSKELGVEFGNSISVEERIKVLKEIKAAIEGEIKQYEGINKKFN